MRSTQHLIVGAIIAVSCGLAISTVHAQNPANPCTQISAEQVSSALGETVAAGKQGPAVTCTWVAEKPTHQIVTLSYSPPGDWTTRKTRQVPGVTNVSVSGIGDDALAQTVANFTTLFVKKSATIFMVRVYGVPDTAKQLAIETPIAKVVVGKS